MLAVVAHSLDLLVVLALILAATGIVITVRGPALAGAVVIICAALILFLYTNVLGT